MNVVESMQTTRKDLLVGWYIEPGSGHRRRVEIDVSLEPKDGGGTRLSIQATGGRARKSDGAYIRDSLGDPRDYHGGQAISEVEAVTQFAAGWNGARRDRLVEIWQRWHLNDMNAACEHQRALGWTYATHRGQYCPTCGYEIGTAWLYEELPADVVAFVREVISPA